MKKMIINGSEITTNFRQSWNGYPICDGHNKKTMAMCLPKNCCETDEEMLYRLVDHGYTRITFYEATTRVKGYHDLIAFCK